MSGVPKDHRVRIICSTLGTPRQVVAKSFRIELELEGAARTSCSVVVAGPIALAKRQSPSNTTAPQINADVAVASLVLPDVTIVQNDALANDPAAVLAARQEIAIVIGNLGVDNAENVVVTIVTPTIFTIVGITLPASFPGLKCSDPISAIPVTYPNTIVCTLNTTFVSEQGVDNFLIVLKYQPPLQTQFNQQYPGKLSADVVTYVNVTSTTADNDLKNNNRTLATQVAMVADLGVSFPPDAAITAGTKTNFNVTVCNKGPSPATNIVLNWTLPPGTTLDGAVTADIPAGVTCAVVAGTNPQMVQCSGFKLDGPSFIDGTPIYKCNAFRATVFVDPAAGGVNASLGLTTIVSQTATVSSDVLDVFLGDNYDIQYLTIVSEHDVAITKGGDQFVLAGGATTYLINVKNAGPAQAYGVFVNDSVPAPFIVTDVTTEQGNCSFVGNLVRCDIGNMSPPTQINAPFRSSVGITIFYRVPADAEPTTNIISSTVSANAIRNTAYVYTVSPDKQLDNNLEFHLVDIRALADVKISKGCVRGPFISGNLNQFEYVLNVSNVGISAARGVVILDQIPSQFRVISVTPTATPAGGVSCDAVVNNLVRCTYNQAMTTQVVKVVVRVEVDSGITEGIEVTNRANVTTTTREVNFANNEDSCNTVIQPPPDVTIFKTASKQQILVDDPSETFFYTITLRNNGPTDAVNVGLIDTVPRPFLVYNTALITFSPAGYSYAENCAAQSGGNNNVLNCNFGGLAAGQNITVTVPFKIDQADARAEFVTNFANVTATLDSNLNNNRANATIELIVGSNVFVMVSSTTPCAGRTGTVSVDYGNKGPSTARGVVLSNTIDSRATITGAVGPAGVNCTIVSATFVRCNIPDLPAVPSGAPAGQVVITFSLPASLTPANGVDPIVKLSFRAEISSSTFEKPGDQTNNAVDWSIDWKVCIDVYVTKTGTPTVTAGSSGYVFNMSVGNFGPSDAKIVTLSDPLPAGFVPVSYVVYSNVANNNGICQFTEQDKVGALLLSSWIVTCQWPEQTFTVSRVDTVSVTYSVDSQLPAGTHINRVVVKSPNAANTNDVDTRNNEATFPVISNVRAPLSITKAAPGVCIIAGGAAGSYSIVVTNAGPSVATGISLVDNIPFPFTLTGSANLVFGSSATPCTVSSGQIKCDQKPTLGPRESFSVVYSLLVGADNVNASQVQNIATVTAVQDCSITACSASSVSASNFTDVCAVADLEIEKSNQSPAPAIGYIAGEGVYTFTIRVNNKGPSVAQSVVVRDYDFTGGVITGISGDGATCNATTLVCTYPKLEKNVPKFITVTFTIPFNKPCGPYVNYGSVSSSTYDPILSNNVDDASINVIARHTLSIKKEGTARIVAGRGVGTHVVTITNNGPSTATAVVFTDAVPFPLKVTSFTCGSASQNLRCELGNLNPGSSFSVSYTFTVDADAPLGFVTNVAKASSGLNNPCELELSPKVEAELNVEVVCEDNITLTKDDNRVNITAGTGETFVYTITVTNSGPSVARGVTVTDAWPSQLTRTSLPLTNDASRPCVVSFDNIISCPWSTLGVGQTVTIYVNFTVASNIPPQIVPNTVKATTACSARVVTVTSTTEILNKADLGIVKDDCLSTIVAGAALPNVFTFTVTNAGPSDGVNVVVRDSIRSPYTAGELKIERLPIGVGIVGTCKFTNSANTTFECTFSSFPVNGVAVLSLEVRVPYDSLAQYATNCATVSSDVPDSNLVNNEDCDTNKVLTEADLAVTKSLVAVLNPECEIPGGLGIVAGNRVQSVYNVVVVNRGPSTARNVSFTEVFPPSAIIEAFPTDRCSRVTGTVNTFRCTLPTTDLAPIPFSQGYSFEFRFYLAANTPKGLISNFVSVRSDTFDPDLCNNNFTLVSPVCAVSDLGITKTDGVAQVTAGDLKTYKYNITGRNYGPSDASMVQVEDVWPLWASRSTMPGFKILQIVGANCTETPTGLVCTIGNLAVGEQFSFCIYYTVDSCLMACQMCNVAVISSMSVEPRNDVYPNIAEDCNEVRTEADLEICKSDGVEVVTAGDGITYTYVIKVANIGPSCARDVKIVDHFPRQIPQVAGSLSTSVGSCIFQAGNAVGKDFSCNLGLFQVGQSATINISYTVPSSLTACSVVNIVTVSSTTFDPVQCNNDAKDVNAVVETATLTVGKTPDTSTIPVTYRGPHSYTITVKNNGPSTARDVVLTDLWPSSLCQYGERLSIDQGACITTGGDITCRIGDVAKDAVVTIVVPFSVCDKAVAGVVNNTVSAFSPTASKCFDKLAPITLTNVVNRRREVKSAPAVIMPTLLPVAVEMTAPTTAPATMPPMDTSLAPVVVELKATKKSSNELTVLLTNTNLLTVRIYSLSVSDGSSLPFDLTKVSERITSTTCKSFIGRKLPSKWSEECTVTFAAPLSSGVQISAVGIAKTVKGPAPVQGAASA